LSGLCFSVHLSDPEATLRSKEISGQKPSKKPTLCRDCALFNPKKKVCRQDGRFSNDDKAACNKALSKEEEY
jgi:hypothetical protein